MTRLQQHLFVTRIDSIVPHVPTLKMIKGNVCHSPPHNRNNDEIVNSIPFVEMIFSICTNFIQYDTKIIVR